MSPDPTFILIKNIDTFNTSGEETVIGRVVAMSCLITTNYGTILNVLFGDGDGSTNIIQLVLKDQEALQFEANYKIGDLLTCSKFELQSPTRWNSASHGSELHVTLNTVFTTANEFLQGMTVPKQILPTLVPPSQLLKQPSQTKVNFAGYVVKVEAGVTKKNKHKLDLEVYVGMFKVTVTCWNDLAKSLYPDDLVGQIILYLNR